MLLLGEDSLHVEIQLLQLLKIFEDCNVYFWVSTWWISALVIKLVYEVANYIKYYYYFWLRI